MTNIFLGTKPPFWSSHSVLKLSNEVKGSLSYEIEAMLDSLSRGAQKLAPLLAVLLKVVPARLSIIFNCVLQHSEIPLKRLIFPFPWSGVTGTHGM